MQKFSNEPSPMELKCILREKKKVAVVSPWSSCSDCLLVTSYEEAPLLTVKSSNTTEDSKADIYQRWISIMLECIYTG